MDVAINIGKGREVEFYNRVLTNDPTNSALVLVLLESGSAGGVSGLVDFDTLAAILAGGYNEITNAGYARIILDNTDLSAWAPDDAANATNLGLGVNVFPNISAGDIIDLGLVCYDPDTTGGTDANIIPVTGHELRILGAQIPGNGDDLEWDLSTWITAV